MDKNKKKYIDTFSKIIWEDDEMEWTSGTDKSYGEAVYETWRKKLGESPTRQKLRRLEYQRDAVEKRIENLEAEYKDQLNDDSGERYALNTLELIYMCKDAESHINKLLNEYEGSTEKKSGTYGIHQRNREWIVNTFQEVEPEQPSQNKALQRVMKLYYQEFDLSIGKTTILRMLGRAD